MMIMRRALSQTPGLRNHVDSLCRIRRLQILCTTDWSVHLSHVDYEQTSTTGSTTVAKCERERVRSVSPTLDCLGDVRDNSDPNSSSEEQQNAEAKQC